MSCYKILGVLYFTSHAYHNIYIFYKYDLIRKIVNLCSTCLHEPEPVDTLLYVIKFLAMIEIKSHELLIMNFLEQPRSVTLFWGYLHVST